MASMTQTSDSSTPGTDAFAFVAARALKEIALRRNMEGASSSEIAAQFADMMCDSDYVGDDAVAEVLDDEDVAPVFVLDTLIPDVAANIGVQWQTDRMSFAEVTIVSARLQSLAWQYINTYRDAADQQLDAPRILMTTPEGETHTLGAVLALGRFARLGCQVRAAFDCPPRDLAEIIRTGHFDMIALSASASADCQQLERLITHIRKDRSAPPIALGGSFVTDRPTRARDLGADVVGAEVAAALDIIRANHHPKTSSRSDDQNHHDRQYKRTVGTR